VTTQPAVGLGGPATVLFVVVDAGRTAEVERDLEQLAPDGFRTSSRLRSATWMPLPAGYVVMSAGARLLRTTRDPGADLAPAARRGARPPGLDAEAARGGRRLAAGADVQLGQDRRHVVVGGLG
jgi:hypothetical protein